MMKSTVAIVLAAGKGKRMKSARPKVLHPVAGVPMLSYVLDLLRGAERVVVVVGHGAEEVKRCFDGRGVRFATQEEQLGTGHAVASALPSLRGTRGPVLILSGDVPLLRRETIKKLLGLHKKSGSAVTFLSTYMDDPSGYGRVVRDEKRRVTGIVEEKDAGPEERAIKEVNTGTYVIDPKFLRGNIEKLERKNVQGEYYLTDLVGIAVREGRVVSALAAEDPLEVMGVNSRVELARAERIMRRRIIEKLMLSGVTFMDPERTYIEKGARVGGDTTIYPGVRISAASRIGTGCVIEEGAVINDSVIGDGSVVKSYSVIESSRTGKGVSLGPFARLRPGNRIGDNVRIGNFVEVKNSRIGAGTKAGHLSYLGDAIIGKEVNIGAGTITCNYDGRKKHITRIDDGAFIGSDSQMVAPVRIGKGAYVGSGTTVTRDVPSGALVISRAGEKVIEGWVKRKFGK